MVNQLVQYADDTLILTFSHVLLDAKNELEKALNLISSWNA